MIDNVALIRERFYGKLDPEILSENVDWMLAEGFPAGGHFHGRYAVMKEWAPTLGHHFEGMRAVPDAVLAIEGGVLGLGHYVGRAKTTGRDFRVPFAHVLSIKDGQVARLEQHVNTLLLHQAVTEPGGFVGEPVAARAAVPVP